MNISKRKKILYAHALHQKRWKVWRPSGVRFVIQATSHELISSGIYSPLVISTNTNTNVPKDPVLIDTKEKFLTMFGNPEKPFTPMSLSQLFIPRAS